MSSSVLGSSTMLRSLFRKAGLFLLVGMARRLSEAEKPEAEAEADASELEAVTAAETLGGKVPIPATTGAILGAVVAGSEVAWEAAEVEATEAAADGAEVTSVGLTTGEGVGGDILAWNG